MADKSFPASARRLAKSRKDGDVQSHAQVLQSFGFAVSCAGLILLGSIFYESLVALLRLAFNFGAEPKLGDIAQSFAWRSVEVTIIYVLALDLIVATSTFLVGCMLHRFVFSLKPLYPVASRLNPAAGLKRMLAVDKLVDLIVMSVKCFLILAMVSHSLANSLPNLLRLQPLAVNEVGKLVAISITQLLAGAIVLDTVFAFFDFHLQKHRYAKRLRMSIDDVRREGREDAGDPHMRSALKQMQRSL
jgi:flagellar biosynthesis protein FlhB